MKKVLFVVLLLIPVLVVDAQTDNTKVTDPKSTHTTIKVEDLQKSIKDNIAKDYTGFTIKKAKSVSDGKSLTYHVEIVKGTVKETLIYDKDGKFVKKHSEKSNKHQSGTK